MNTKQTRGNSKKLIAYEIDTFLCQLVLVTLANTIAGFINRNSHDGKNPSKHDNNDFEKKTSFEIHWKTKK